MFTHVSRNLSTLTCNVKALLIILHKRSLIESRQCNGRRKIKKQCEDATQKGNNVKASWGPLNIWGPRGNSPCPPPASWWASPHYTAVGGKLGSWDSIVNCMDSRPFSYKYVANVATLDCGLYYQLLHLYVAVVNVDIKIQVTIFCSLLLLCTCMNNQ